jgi:hypothetical protein
MLVASLPLTAVPGNAGTHRALARTSEHHLEISEITIDPMWVVLLDQLDLPNSFPPPDALFAFHRSFQSVVMFEPDRSVYAVFCGKSRNGLFLMFPYTPHEV